MQPRIAAYDKLLNEWDGDCITYDMSFYGVQNVSIIADPALFEKTKSRAACVVCSDPLIPSDMATLLNVLDPDAEEPHQGAALEHQMCAAKCGAGIHLACFHRELYHHDANVEDGQDWYCDECIHLVKRQPQLPVTELGDVPQPVVPRTRSQTAEAQAFQHIRHAPAQDQVLLLRAQKIAVECNLPEFQALDFTTKEGRDAAVKLIRDMGTPALRGNATNAANAPDDGSSEHLKAKNPRCKVASGYFDVSVVVMALCFAVQCDVPQSLKLCYGAS